MIQHPRHLSLCGRDIWEAGGIDRGVSVLGCNQGMSVGLSPLLLMLLLILRLTANNQDNNDSQQATTHADIQQVTTDCYIRFQYLLKAR